MAKSATSRLFDVETTISFEQTKSDLFGHFSLSTIGHLFWFPSTRLGRYSSEVTVLTSGKSSNYFAILIFVSRSIVSSKVVNFDCNPQIVSLTKPR